jgi:hypothetical protein
LFTLDWVAVASANTVFEAVSAAVSAAFDPASYWPGLVPSTELSLRACAAVTAACKAVLSAGGGGGVESFLLHEVRTKPNKKDQTNATLINLSWRIDDFIMKKFKLFNNV